MRRFLTILIILSTLIFISCSHSLNKEYYLNEKTYSYHGVTLIYNVDDRSLTITGYGNEYDGSNYYLGSSAIEDVDKDRITKILVNATNMSLYADIFKGFKNLEEIYLSGTIPYVGSLFASYVNKATIYNSVTDTTTWASDWNDRS